MELENGINVDTMIEAAKKTPSMDVLRDRIIEQDDAGLVFGCECYYCDATPIDLVKRGDALPMLFGCGRDYCDPIEHGDPIFTRMYGDGNKVNKIYCFRCSDEAFYGLKSEYIKNPTKQEECFKAFKSEKYS